MLAIRLNDEEQKKAFAIIERELGYALILRYDSPALLTEIVLVLKGMSVPRILINSVEEPPRDVVGPNAVRSKTNIWEVPLK